MNYLTNLGDRPDDPFEPIVESLLRYPLDSPEFREAAEVATRTDLEWVLSEIRRTRRAVVERQVHILARLSDLEFEYPELAEDGGS